jgi:hypothetical protein
VIYFNPNHCRKCRLICLQVKGVIPIPVAEATGTVDDMVTKFQLGEIEKASFTEDLS